MTIRINTVDKLSALLGIKQGEGQKVLVLSTYSALAIAALVVIQSLITALFLDTYETHYLPYLFAFQSIFFVFVSSVQSSLTVKKTTESLGLKIVFIVSLVLARFFLIDPGPWLVFALYIVLQTLVDILVMISAITVMRTFDTREAKRLSSVINAGGTMGAVLMGVLVPVLAQRFGTESLLLAVIPILGFMLILDMKIFSTYLISQVEEDHESSRSKSFFLRMASAVTDVMKDRLMLTFLALSCTMVICSTLIDFQFKSMLKESYSKDQITAFLGIFFAALNTVALFFQLFVARRILLTFGMVASLLLMPVTLFTGSLIFVFLPSIWVVAGIRFSENVLKYSSFKTASSILYMPYSPAKQTKLKISSDGIFKPLAVLMASGLLILAEKTMSLQMISVTVSVLCVFAVLSAVNLKTPYVEKLRSSLSRRRIRLKDNGGFSEGISEPNVIRAIEETLTSQVEQEVLFSLELIKENLLPVSLERINSLFGHKSALIREEALLVAGKCLGESASGVLLRHLATTAISADQAYCIRALCCISGADHARDLFPYLSCNDTRVLGEALIYLILRGDSETRSIAESRLLQLFDSALPEEQRMAAYIAGEVALDSLVKPLIPLLESSDELVLREAIKSAGRLSSPTHLPFLIHALTSGGMSGVAKSALVSYGPEGVRFLRETYERDEGNSRLRLGILSTLGRIVCDASVENLVDITVNADSIDRNMALSSLNKINKTFHGMHRFREKLLQIILAEIEIGQKLNALLVIFSKSAENLDQIDPFRGNIFCREITHSIARNRENIFRELGLLYDQKTIYRAFLNYVSTQKRDVANSIELLENIIHKDTASYVIPFLEDTSPMAVPTPIREVRGQCAVGWQDLLLETDDPWLKAVAPWVVTEKTQESGGPSMWTMDRIFFLKSVPMFSLLSGEELRPVAEMFAEESVEEGQVVCRENDPSDSFYIVLNGNVSVEKEKERINVLSKGDYFGEMALFDNAPRSATVRAISDCDLLKLDRSDFYELIEEYPELTRGIITTLSQRLRAFMEKSHAPSND